MTERSAVIARLQDWQAGTLDPKAVWEWALQVKEANDPADEVVRDVVDVLAELPQDLVLVEDAQVLIEALENPLDETVLSQNLVWNYFDIVDQAGRKTALADDPFYGPFCGEIY